MDDEHYMRLAIREAEKALAAEEVPIGAVLVIDDTVIAKGFNQTELLKDSTAHAEILALTAAYHALGSKYVPDATLFVTIEPCLMCSGALHWSKLKRVVFGANDEKNGYKKYTGVLTPFHPKTIVSSGILADECAALMTNFFRSRR